MKNLFFFLVLALAVFIQVTLFRELELFGVLPNIALISLFFVAFYIKDNERVMLSALFLGLLFDVFSGVSFGIFSLIFLSISFIIILVKEAFVSNQNITTFILIVFLGTISYYLLTVILVNIFNILQIAEYKVDINLIILKYAFFEALYNMLVAFIFIPAKKFL